jgi:hypothetical protein
VKKIALFECGERRCWALLCDHVVRGMKSRAVREEDERTLPDLQISGIIQLGGSSTYKLPHLERSPKKSVKDL